MSTSGEKALFWATGMGIGNVRYAPGTFGTLLGIPLAYVFSFLPLVVRPAAVFLLCLFAVVVSERAAMILKQKDPGCIVIDEIAGYCTALALMPRHWFFFLAGFVAFRFFDILKPWPVGYLDRRFRGGFGIVADDVMAGIMAAAAIYLVIIVLVLIGYGPGAFFGC